MDKEDGWLFHSNSSVLTLSIHDNFPLVFLCPLNYISKRDAEELEQKTHVKKRERERERKKDTIQFLKITTGTGWNSKKS